MPTTFNDINITYYYQIFEIYAEQLLGDLVFADGKIALSSICGAK
jgi:hypothetical protein